MTRRVFAPVTVVCDDCGAELARTHGTAYMEGTITIRPELVLTHDCPERDDDRSRSDSERRKSVVPRIPDSPPVHNL